MQPRISLVIALTTKLESSIGAHAAHALDQLQAGQEMTGLLKQIGGYGSKLLAKERSNGYLSAAAFAGIVLFTIPSESRADILFNSQVGNTPFEISAEALAKAIRLVKYKNNSTSSYVSSFYLIWKSPSTGKKCKAFRLENNTHAGKSTVEVDLINHYQGLDYKEGNSSECPLLLGTEVWGWVQIFGGDNDGCRQSKKMIYHPNGGVLKYSTGGTSTQNNRCKISSVTGQTVFNAEYPTGLNSPRWTEKNDYRGKPS